MNEVTLITGEADDGQRERLDQEINAFNAPATGHHDARLLSIAARGDTGDLDGGLHGWTWGGCGYIDLPLALLRRRPAKDTGISMQGDTALWRTWLALTPL
jgi:hypothetical protein